MESHTTNLADDLLEGVKAIANETGMTQRRVSYLVEREMIPCGRLGRKIIASRKRIREFMGTVATANGPKPDAA